MQLDQLLATYGILPGTYRLSPLGNGLINSTWKLEADGISYVWQQINTRVFTQPNDIHYNLHLIGEYCKQTAPNYVLPLPLQNKSGNTLLLNEQGEYFRLWPFVENSHSIDVAQNPNQAYEAARQFGKFTRVLTGFDCHQLRNTIYDFHNLSLRFRQFLIAAKNGNPLRIRESKKTIEALTGYENIVTMYENILQDSKYRLRVTHHDTKISNVLFNESQKGICVIDLDTVMPGYFISDLGDMMRTYLCPVSEEETDLNKILIRTEYYEALSEGYLENMKDLLSPEELALVHYSGQYMIYMQALRFLTDHLRNDIYYGARYPGHNFNRAQNQLRLLEKLNVLKTL